MPLRNWSKGLPFLSLAAVLAVSLPLVAGFFGTLHPALDAFAHFRLHLAALLALCALPLLPMRRWWMHGVLALLMAAGAAASARGLPEFGIGPVHAAFRERPVDARTYRLLHLNLRYDHTEPGRVIALLEAQKPDFVALNEVSDMWTDQLRGLLSTYPYQQRCGRRTPVGGVAVLSRLPFSPERMNRCADDGSMAITTVELDGRLLDLAALHLQWPWPHGQDAQLSQLAPLLRTLGAEAMLTGDLNAAPWSHAARRVAEPAALAPVRPVGPTWLFRWLPSGLRPWVGLPLDHAFTKGDVVLYSALALEEVGSDHLPILIEFGLPAKDMISEHMIAAAW